MADLKQQLAKAGVDVSRFEWPDPETLPRLAVHGKDAIACWERLRALVPVLHRYPLLVGSDEELERLEEQLENQGSGPVGAPVVAPLDPAAWVEARIDERIAELRDFDEAEGVDEYERLRRLFHGTSPTELPADHVPTRHFTVPSELGSGKPHERVNLVLVPTEVPWEAPFHLCLGGWNECPAPGEHAELMQAWNQEYGAEPVAITTDTVEMRVARPPTTPAAAMRLAVQQYLYCADIVEQGVQSIEALAATLLGAPVWYFWWD